MCPDITVEDDWKSHKSGLIARGGDVAVPPFGGVIRLVYYAVGLGIVFAVYEAVSLPYHGDPSDAWGWHVNVKPVIVSTSFTTACPSRI